MIKKKGKDEVKKKLLELSRQILQSEMNENEGRQSESETTQETQNTSTLRAVNTLRLPFMSPLQRREDLSNTTKLTMVVLLTAGGLRRLKLHSALKLSLRVPVMSPL